MDCGAPRFVGPGAKDLYNYMMEQSKKAIKNKEKRELRLKEFSERAISSAGSSDRLLICRS